MARLVSALIYILKEGKSLCVCETERDRRVGSALTTQSRPLFRFGLFGVYSCYLFSVHSRLFSSPFRHYPVHESGQWCSDHLPCSYALSVLFKLNPNPSFCGRCSLVCRVDPSLNWIMFFPHPVQGGLHWIRRYNVVVKSWPRKAGWCYCIFAPVILLK